MADANPNGDDEVLLRHVPGGSAWQAPGPYPPLPTGVNGRHSTQRPMRMGAQTCLGAVTLCQARSYEADPTQMASLFESQEAGLQRVGEPWRPSLGQAPGSCWAYGGARIHFIRA
jgi:hypothetical protein